MLANGELIAVTGSTSPTGRALIDGFQNEGYRPIPVARDREKVTEYFPDTLPAVYADMTDFRQVEELTGAIINLADRSGSGRLGALVLAQATGLIGSPEKAQAVNCDSKLALVGGLMRGRALDENSTVVDISSIPAHSYPDNRIPDKYKQTARTKKAGEAALAELAEGQPDTAPRILTVAVGPIVGTLGERMWERFAGTTEQQPKSETDFVAYVVRKACEAEPDQGHLPSGSTLLVLGASIDKERADGQITPFSFDE